MSITRLLTNRRVECRLGLGDIPKVSQHASPLTPAQCDLIRSTFSAHKPLMVMVAGNPGNGKTTVGRAIASATDAPSIENDIILRRLAGVDLFTRLDDPTLRKVAQSKRLRRSLAEMVNLAEDSLGRWGIAILDRIFPNAFQRRIFTNYASEWGARYLFVECVCDDMDLLKARMDARPAQPQVAAEATYEMFTRARDRFEPLTEIPASNRIRLDTAQTFEKTWQDLTEQLVNTLNT